MHRTLRADAARFLFVLAILPLLGCKATSKPPVKYPEGSLRVRYESAEHYSTCLVASVAMAANYLLDDSRYNEPGILADLHRQGCDETRVGDVREWLGQQGLHLIALKGSGIDGKPPLAMRYWTANRGYPVICVINRDPDSEPGFNHAVVVIGISGEPELEFADTIHYFDPSSERPLHSDPAEVFDVLWQRCDRAMMIVVDPPDE